MKTPFIRLALVTAAIGAAFSFAAPDALAQQGAAFKTGQQAGMEKALEAGPVAVRRYIERTRMIYALTWSDFYPAE